MSLMRYLILPCFALIALAGMVHAQDDDPLSAEPQRRTQRTMSTSRSN